MTPEAQRIAISKACGWTFEPTATDGIPEWHRPDGSVCNSGIIPDYLNDLNAMHEAEKVLFPSKLKDYDWTLFSIVHPRAIYTREFFVWHATAAQRAEAFLRIIGKWTDD